MSQAQLGELVGRSASSIRSWERDVSTPTDPSVINALSAILDIDGRSLYDKAGVDLPAEETHPTVEQALASLAPLPLEDPIEETVEPDPVVAASHDLDEVEPGLDADSELEAEVHEHEDGVEPEPEHLREQEPEFESFSLESEPTSISEQLVAAHMESNREPSPAFVSPPEPYVITAPTPPVVEPSYVEDTDQRQMYRVRNLATIVLVVALAILLLWSLSNAVDAIGTWWDEFFQTLRV